MARLRGDSQSWQLTRSLLKRLIDLASSEASLWLGGCSQRHQHSTIKCANRENVPESPKVHLPIMAYSKTPSILPMKNMLTEIHFSNRAQWAL
ncbi:hypothetical protein MHYP_G00111330 [Metynnis hypsauchen]